jgi:hypothetical protein
MAEPLKPTDSLTVQELANLFCIPVAAVITAIETQRRNFNKPFYTLQDLAVRWNCTPSNIHNIIRKYDARTMNLGQGKKRSKRLVPAETVELIERQSFKFVP